MPGDGWEPPTVNRATASVPGKRLKDIGADYFAWADDGKTVTWAVGSSLFREPVSAISFEPPKEEKKEDEAKEGDKKDAAVSSDDSKKDEKKEEKKPEKLKEEDKNVEETAMALGVPRETPKGTIVLRGATAIS